MPKVIMYSKENCVYCTMAKSLLTARHIAYEEIRVDTNPTKLEEMINLSNRRTVPQIFINDAHIGGYDDLVAFANTGGLDKIV